METIKIDKLCSIAGTYLQERISLPYNTIVAFLGKHLKGENKTDAEWHVVTPYGVGTIYNYKDGVNYMGRKEGIAIKDLTEWHIGGENYATGLIIKAALEAFECGYNKN